MSNKIGILDPDGNNDNPLTNEPYSDNYKKLANIWRTFPAYENAEQIIDDVMSSGKSPILAKVPIILGPCSVCAPFPDPDTAPRNELIEEYNKIIDALAEANGIGIAPIEPDFYNYFRANQDEFADNLHPNGVGYQSMADLWFNALP